MIWLHARQWPSFCPLPLLLARAHSLESPCPRLNIPTRAGGIALSSVKWITRRDWELIFKRLIADGDICIVQFVDTCLRIRSNGKTYLRDLQLREDDGRVVYARSASLESIEADDSAPSPQHSPQARTPPSGHDGQDRKPDQDFDGISVKGTAFKVRDRQRRASAAEIHMSHEARLHRRTSWQRTTATVMLDLEHNGEGPAEDKPPVESNSTEKV